MERRQALTAIPSLNSASTLGLNAHGIDEFSRRRQSSAGGTGDRWAMPLSLQAFHERIVLLAKLELPCVFYLGRPLVDRIRRGVIRKIERHVDRLNLLGDDFALFLHQRNIESIWLTHEDVAGTYNGLAIEIYGRDGRLMACILGLSEGVGREVWQDVMGNPSLGIA